MLIPKALPDEFVRGYRGRIRHVNGMKNGKEVTNALRHLKSSGEEAICGGERTAELNLYAVANEMSTEEFASMHSMLPFTRAVVSEGNETPHGSPKSIKVTVSMGMHAPCKSAMHCTECVKEDRDFWGYAYFRRMHQLPGVHWCTKHSLPLVGELNWQAFDFEPGNTSKVLSTAMEKMKRFSDQPAAIQKYVEFATAYIDEPGVISIQHILSKIVQKMADLGLNCTEDVVNGLIINNYPQDWLRTVIPTTRGPGVKHNLFVFDRILRPHIEPFSTEKYLILLPLLFDEVDVALNWLKTPSVENLAVQKKSQRYSPDIWATKEAFALYVNAKGSHRRMAMKLNRQVYHASNTMKAHGWPSLGKLSQPMLLALYDYYQNELPIADACLRHGAEQQKTESLIRTAGQRFWKALQAIHSSESKSIRTSKATKRSEIDVQHIGAKECMNRIIDEDEIFA